MPIFARIAITVTAGAAITYLRKRSIQKTIDRTAKEMAPKIQSLYE